MTGPEIVPVSSTGAVTPLIVSSPWSDTPLALARDRARDEAEHRELLGVEEVGRLQVAGEILVVHDDARDLRRALEPAVGELRVEVGEGAAEGEDVLCVIAKPMLECTGSRPQVPVEWPSRSWPAR